LLDAYPWIVLNGAIVPLPDIVLSPYKKYLFIFKTLYSTLLDFTAEFEILSHFTYKNIFMKINKYFIMKPTSDKMSHESKKITVEVDSQIKTRDKKHTRAANDNELFTHIS
jgi:hypothetical protein